MAESPQNLFTGYRPPSGTFDELFQPDGSPRPAFGRMVSQQSTWSPEQVARCQSLAELALLNQGVTFSVYSDSRGTEKIFPFCLVPRLISAKDWARLEEGLTAVKFHCWCEPSRDVPMVETVHRAMADKCLALMLDVEQRYTRDQALTAAKRLERLGLTWFEAPLLDTDLEGYLELRRLLTASRGRPRNLSQTHQQELKRILRKLGEGEGQPPPPAPTAT